MKSGETAGHGNGRRDVLNRTQAQARRPGSGSRAVGVSRAERGNDGSPKGAKPRRGFDAQHDSATGHVSGPGTPGLFRESSAVLSHQPCLAAAPGADLLQPSGEKYRNRHYFRNSTHPLRYASYRYH